MKQLFCLFGLYTISYSSFGQQAEGHQKTGDKFGVSVFANSHTLHPTKRADIGLAEKLSAQFPKWYISTDRWTGGFKDLTGPGIVVSGDALSDKVALVMNNQLNVVGVKSSDWVLSGQATNADHYQYLYYTQSVAGNKVAFSTMTFRFTPDNKLVRITMNAYGNPNLSLVPTISTDKALEVAVSDLDGAIVSAKSIQDNWEWFPIPSENGYTLHPAYKFLVEGSLQESSSVPLNMTGYVDAINGTLLYRDNETKDVTNLKVVGNVYTNGYLNPTTKVGLPYVTVKIGATTLLANDTGFVSSTAFSIPTNDSVFLKGRWSIVKSAKSSNKTPVAYITVSKLDSDYTFPNTTTLGIASSSRHINAYYHVNTVHDFMKKQYPSFTGLDYPLVTNVDVAGTCNAYYTGGGGSSINFFPAGGGCVSFAEIRDVVYHEYGHGIVDKLYTSLKGSGIANGGLNEGQADVWGLSITENGILAEGSMGAGTFIRRYDLAPKVYPQDLTGEVHANGEIIAGAWWDYGVNVGSVAEMAKLFAKTLYDVPDGPNGTEGVVFHAVLMSALINDDNDADLSNGTPHFTQIVTAFAKHGIYLLEDVDIAHTELPHQPKLTPITVNASLSVTNPYFFKSLMLVYRNNRLSGVVWDTIVMNNLGSYSFTATIPAQSEGTIVDYYFAAKDLVNIQGVFFPYNYYPASMAPENTVNIYHQFGVGITAQQKIDFETPVNSDWQLGLSSDGATVGKWIQAIPIVAYNSGLMSQTDKDHTSGTGKCLVTGNAPLATSSAYTASVKNGSTTVLTPMYDLSTYTNPIIEFYRWYGNGRGYYPKTVNWRVLLSNGSPVIYRDVDYTTQSDYQWRRRMFKPLEVFSSASQMQLKFIATEAHPTTPAGSFALVEAAVDDIVIYEGIETSSGIAKAPKALAKIYPNPAVQTLNIELPATYQELSITLYNMSGKLISTVPVTNGATKYAIETKNMAAGQYMLMIKMDKTIQTSTITIQAP
ncbi:MAG: T9SS type A sorting domain-containing protein [Phycisphaerales bacterium]|nr:T9SS type A sorting domain-containing protein [Phycisphaerales bacterium]